MRRRQPVPIPIWIIALLIFAGAVGKSAQFPLHVWLPGRDGGPDARVAP